MNILFTDLSLFSTFVWLPIFKDAKNEDGVLILIYVISSTEATVLHVWEWFRKIAEFVVANIEAIRTTHDR